jgi:hypothetical protein
MGSPREIHLVGSVPLGSPEEVFRLTGRILGERVKKIPDGETGRRKNWVNFQYGVLLASGDFEPVGAAIDPDALALEGDGRGADYAFTPLRLKPGRSGQGLKLGPLGYAENARASYATFKSLRDGGAIPPAARFQVALPTPLAPVAIFVAPESFFEVFPVYRAALLAELDEILGAIPHADLAVQWDVAVEFGLWEGLFPRPPGDWKAMLLDGMAELGARVPADVWLGYHLCYGDRGHKHFVEPRDAANLVEVSNGITARLQRPMQWIHRPVPKERHDDAFFAPLATLALQPETTLFLGLVHRTDGVPGARRRIAAAEKFAPRFGIGTECGLGRRDPATIPDLLQLHVDIAS